MIKPFDMVLTQTGVVVSYSSFLLLRTGCLRAHHACRCILLLQRCGRWSAARDARPLASVQIFRIKRLPGQQALGRVASRPEDNVGTESGWGSRGTPCNCRHVATGCGRKRGWQVQSGAILPTLSHHAQGAAPNSTNKSAHLLLTAQLLPEPACSYHSTSPTLFVL